MKIIFVGAGNLATQIAVNLFDKKINIVQIYNRTENSAKVLGKKVNSDYITDLSKLNLNADIYFITVKDSVIPEIIKYPLLKNKFLVHCSGSTDINIFNNITDNFGVFYPLQTFSKNKDVNFKEIPICIEANTNVNLEKLKYLADKLSSNVQIIGSNQRKYLHLSAVFANNFSNHFITISKEILKDKNIDSKILYSLMRETVDKVFFSIDENTQTGPALRGDKNIIDFHLNLLKDYPKFEKMYRFVSKSINENLEL